MQLLAGEEMQDSSFQISKYSSQSQSHSPILSLSSFLQRMRATYRIIQQRQRILRQIDVTRADFDSGSERRSNSSYMYESQNYEEIAQGNSNSIQTTYIHQFQKQNQSILGELKREWRSQIQKINENQLNKNTFQHLNQNYTFLKQNYCEDLQLKEETKNDSFTKNQFKFQIDQQKQKNRFFQRMNQVEDAFGLFQILQNQQSSQNYSLSSQSQNLSNQNQSKLFYSQQQLKRRNDKQKNVYVSLIKNQSSNSLSHDKKHKQNNSNYSNYSNYSNSFHSSNSCYNSNSLNASNSSNIHQNQTFRVIINQQTHISSDSSTNAQSENSYLEITEATIVVLLTDSNTNYQSENSYFERTETTYLDKFQRNQKIQSKQEQQTQFQKLLQFWSQNSSISSISSLSQQKTFNLGKEVKKINLMSYKQQLQAIIQTLEIERIMFGKNHPEYQETFSKLGAIYYKNNQYDLALKNYVRNLEIINENEKDYDIIEKNQKQTILLNNIGTLYFSKQNFDQALKYYNNAHKMIQSNNIIIHNKQRYLSQILINIGNVYKQVKCSSLSKYYYEQALFIIQKLKNQQNNLKKQTQQKENKSIQAQISLKISICYNNIGVYYFDVGNYDSAKQYYEKSLQIKQKVAFQSQLCKEFYSNTLNNLGILFQLQQDFTKALEYYEHCLKEYRECIEDPSLEQATVLNNIGNIYLQQELYDKALQHYQKSFEIKKQLLGTNLKAIAGFFNNIGVMYFKKKQYDRVLQFWNQVLQIVKIQEQSKIEQINKQSNSKLNFLIKIYSNIGMAYLKKGEYQKALEYFYKERQILKSKIDIDDNLEYLQKELQREGKNYNQQFFFNLINVGEVYQSVDEQDKALKNYQLALKLIQKSDYFLNKNLEKAQLLNRIGLIYLYKKQQKQPFIVIDEALRYFQRSTQIYQHTLSNTKKKQKKININLLNTLQNYARAFQQKKLFDRALQIYFQVLDLKKSLFGDQSMEYAKANQNIGNTYFYQREYEKCQKFYLKVKDAIKIKIQNFYLQYLQKAQLEQNKNQIHLLGQNSHNLGNLYFKSKEFKKSFQYYEKAIQVWQKQQQINHIIQKRSDCKSYSYSQKSKCKEEVQFYLSISKQGYQNARFMLELNFYDINKNKQMQEQILLKVKQMLNSLKFF